MDYSLVAKDLTTEDIIKLLKESEQLKSLQEEFNELKNQLEWFKKQIFGKKSEKRKDITSPNIQLSLGEQFESKEEDLPKPEEKQTITYQRGKAKKKKIEDQVNDKGLRFDSNVEVKEVTLMPDEVKYLNESEYEIINTKEKCVLTQLPASYKVIKYIQPVVKLKQENKLISKQAELVFEKSYLDVSVISNLLVDKFLYHFPLYRQHQKMERAGIKLARAVLTNTVHKSADLLNLVYKAHLNSILSSQVLAMDEVPIKAGVNKNKNQMNKGYFWPIFGDKKEVAFPFDPSRQHKVVFEVLGRDFKGTLISDGYEAYTNYTKELESVEHAGCYSHTRRKFLEAESDEPELVNKALSYIRELYLIEKEIKGKESKKRQEIRGARSKQIVDEFFVWLRKISAEKALLPTNLFTKAVSYTLKREKTLRVFLSNPEVPIDTNYIEREIRSVVLGRKNWLFCTTEIGAEVAGKIYSLIATCKLHDINPYVYFVDVLQRVSSHPVSRIDELIPRNWKHKFKDGLLVSEAENF